MAEQQLGFCPVLPGNFRAPWFLDCAWGEYERTDAETVLTIADGALKLRTLVLPGLARVCAVTADGKDLPFSFENGKLSVQTTVTKQLVVKHG
jgi:hypothetical protein